MGYYVFSDNALLSMILLSWAVFAVGIGIAWFQFTFRKEKSISAKIMTISVVLFISILILRFSTFTFISQLIMSEKADEELLGVLDFVVPMHWLETLVRSLVQTIRTFAFDEDYALFAIVADRMSESVLSAHEKLPVIYRVHAGLASALAPVAGGAIIFDVLTRVFPKLKLRIMPFWREFYVFSELNDQSLALARSIKDDYSDSKKNRRKKLRELRKGIPLSSELSIEFPEIRKEKGEEKELCIFCRLRKKAAKKREERKAERQLPQFLEKLLSKLPEKRKEAKIGNCVFCKLKRKAAKKKEERRARRKTPKFLKKLLSKFPVKKKEKKIKRERPKLPRKRKPVIVFTDAYIDRESEAVSERIASARAMGAICLTDDIFHIRIRGFIRRLFRTKFNYLLMDEKEDKNLHTLSMLSEHKKGNRLLRTSVYLFSNNTSANDLAGCVMKKMKKTYGENNKKLPLIRVIQGYRNLVFNLLRDVPLYEPLIGRDLEGEKTLNVTIIGSGDIGMQMFLATYWMGQMLGVRLFINVISNESRKNFTDRLNFINKDILRTESGEMAKAAEEAKDNPEKKSDFMRIYTSSDEPAPAYFTFRYVRADVMSGRLYTALNKKMDENGFRLRDSDYFVIAIGDDEKNIFVANKIRQYLGRTILRENKVRRAIINYVVFDKDVCSTLNAVQTNPNIYMNAFGSLGDVYNYDNVFMSKSYGAAVEVNATYVRKAFADKAFNKNDMNKMLDDEYNFWSSIARGIHIPYKYFSAGVITKSSVFDGAETVTENSEVFNNYLRKVCIELCSKNNDLPSMEEREELYYKLTWLEHRRWNAFMRTGGFTTPTREQVDKFAYVGSNKGKDVTLKLHPCLVECDDKKSKIPAKEIRAATIAPTVKPDISVIKKQNYDRLDAVSLYLYFRTKDKTEKEEKSRCIYKAYDAPYSLSAEEKSIKIQ